MDSFEYSPIRFILRMFFKKSSSYLEDLVKEKKTLCHMHSICRTAIRSVKVIETDWPRSNNESYAASTSDLLACTSQDN